MSRPEIEALNWRTKSSGIAPGTGNEASVTESIEPVVRASLAVLIAKPNRRWTSSVYSPSWLR